MGTGCDFRDVDEYKERFHVGVCVLHIQPLFLPVDIQHKQCPCRVFNPREVQALSSQNYDAYILQSKVRDVIT